MIGAFARAGARLAEPRYLDAARRAAALRARHAGGRRDGHAAALVARRQRPRAGLPRRLRVPGRGPARAARRDRRAGVGRGGAAPRGGAGGAARRRRRRRLLRRGRRPAPAVPREAGVRRRRRLRQRHRRAQRGRAGAAHRRRAVGGSRRGHAARVRRRRWRRPRSPTSRSCARSSACASSSGRRHPPCASSPRRAHRRAARSDRAEPAAAPTASLEDEAYDAVEVYGRLGSSEDEEWKPFQLELDVRRGWHTNANPAARGPRRRRA